MQCNRPSETGQQHKLVPISQLSEVKGISQAIHTHLEGGLLQEPSLDGAYAVPTSKTGSSDNIMYEEREWLSFKRP